MKILVSGSAGHMGRIVCEMAQQGTAGAELAGRVSPSGAEGALPNFSLFDGEADCVVDFSNHAGTAELLEFCVSRKLPVVIATTGQTPEERSRIEEAAAAIPVFFAANTSVGVAVLCDLARRAAAMFPDADIEIVETHHNRKLDVPSGTALMLAGAIREALPENVLNVGRHENGRRSKREIGIHSVRLGNEVGTHEILISTGSETITLKHQAQSRALFAEGALKAAAFLCRQSAGLYTMKDLLA